MTVTPDLDDPAAAFAGLMSGAAQDAAPREDEAPFGYTVDRATGEHRPKKSPGRPRKPPSLDELKAGGEQAGETSPSPEAPADRAPARPKRGRRHRGASKPAAEEPGMPQHRPGVITKGVNRLYRKIGRIVKAMDADIGIAIIESTVNDAAEGEDDNSVGAAWDEVARTNPRIRRFLLKAIAGGAVGQLLMAHAPIFLAILMKDGIRRHIPFVKLMEAFLSEPDEEGVQDVRPGEAPRPGGLADLVAGLRPEDLQQMMAMAQSMMGRGAADVVAGRVVPDRPVP
jgi:hypothetical protein